VSEPFIPRDKPKSWVIFISACLVGLLVFAPVAFLGVALEIQFLRYIGMAGLVACWTAAVLSWIVFRLGTASGKYRNLSARDWKEQVW